MKGLYLLGTKLPAWKRDNLITIVFQMRNSCDAPNGSGQEGGAGRVSKLTWELAKRFADYVLSDKIDLYSELAVEFINVDDYAEVNLMDWISDYFTREMEHRNQKLYFRFHSGWENFQMDEVWRYLRKNERNVEVEIVLDNFLDVKESVIRLWEKGIPEVFVHMEPEDEEKETQIFEKELRELADYALENQLFRRCRCNYFEEEISGCLWETSRAAGDYRNSGLMVVPSGDIYSFVRDLGCSFERQRKWPVGSIEAGVDPERLCSPYTTQPDKMDAREEALQIVRIRANEYYFAQLWSRYRIRRTKNPRLQRMYIPLENCNVIWRYGADGVLSGMIREDDVLERALKYCEENGIEAVLLHPSDQLLVVDNPRLERMRSVHVVAAAFYEAAKVWYENVWSAQEQDMMAEDEFFIQEKNVL